MYWELYLSVVEFVAQDIYCFYQMKNVEVIVCVN